MSQQFSDKVLVTFRDVAACFSEEEWKLLHDWQKEVYKSVMKEIHQALISLGYQILNPEMLLRIYQGGEAYSRDPHHPERRAEISDPCSFCHPAVNPDILLRIKHEKEPHYRVRHNSEEKGFQNRASTGDMAASSNVLKSKENVHVKDSPGSEVKESSGSISAGQDRGSAFLNPNIATEIEEESGACLIYHHAVEEGDISSTDTISEHADISIIVKKEEDDYSVDHPASERREGNTTPTGSAFLNPNILMSIEEESSAYFIYDHVVGGGDISSTDAISAEHAAISFIIKKEDDDYSVDHPASERREGNTSPTGQPKTGDMKEINAYPCNKCEKSFTRKEHLVLHQQIHTKDRIFSCTECDKRFQQKASLLYHLRIHTGERPFSCTECKMSFNQKATLLKHLLVHTRERPFSCTDCEKTFSQKGNLLRHQIIHTGQRNFSCTECEKNFSHKSSLLIHQKMHIGDKPFSCTECEKSFGHKSSLLIHQRIHIADRPFSCTECDEKFRQKAYLRRHKRIHSGQRNFSCTKCDKRFHHNAGLLKHLETHTSEKPFSCTECEKSFRRKADLLRHQRIHTVRTNITQFRDPNRERPFSCTECEKRFHRKHDLFRHQRIHTRARVFSYTECEKSFSQKSEFLKHQRIHTVEMDNNE